MENQKKHLNVSFECKTCEFAGSYTKKSFKKEFPNYTCNKCGNDLKFRVWDQLEELKKLI